LIPILFQDEWLVAVSKPSGVAVHRGWAREGPMALQLVRDTVGARVYPLHRLDRATSGVLVFALDPATAAACGALFAGSQVGKVYLALVRGVAPEHVVVDHPLRPDRGTERQPALTELTRLGVSPVERCSLVEARPRTGRLHQVRRHLKHLSHPIVGDVRYGKGDINRHFRAAWDLRRLALHASRLRLSHPVTGEWLDLRAPLPQDLSLAFTRLGLSLPTS
jgi:tRNA pseudouridine65 synthase